jgi:hypothetical protein
MCIAFFVWKHPQAPDLLLLALFNRDEIFERYAARFVWETMHAAGLRHLEAGYVGGRHPASRPPFAPLMLHFASACSGPQLRLITGKTLRISSEVATWWREARGCASASRGAPPSSPISGR